MAADISLAGPLAELPEEIKAAVVKRATRSRYSAGQVLYLQGEPPEQLFILVSGWVKAIRISPEGREQAMLFLKAGEIFGDVAVFTGIPYPGTVIALEEVQCLVIERSAVMDLITGHPELAHAFIRKLSERIIYFVELVEDLALRDVQARIALTLLKHAERSDDRLVVPRRSWTTYDEMATRLGTVRDVLSRALRGLENEGLLQVKRNEIVILDEQGLARRGNT